MSLFITVHTLQFSWFGYNFSEQDVIYKQINSTARASAYGQIYMTLSKTSREKYYKILYVLISIFSHKFGDHHVSL